MSFDIIILKPSRDINNISDLEEVDDSHELGLRKNVYAELSRYFPECETGLWQSGRGYAVEISSYEDNSQSIHMCLKYGHQWSEILGKEFMEILKSLCVPNGWAAFSVQDNERIA